jgi:hypothetical protein
VTRHVTSPASIDAVRKLPLETIRQPILTTWGYNPVAYPSFSLMQVRGAENRRSARRWMRREAHVTFKGREQSIGCVIHDMSDGGARISLDAGPCTLPRAFTLVLLKDCLQRNCSVVWTNGRFFGVKFISEWFGAKLSERPRFQDVRQDALNQCLTVKVVGQPNKRTVFGLVERGGRTALAARGR